MSPARKSADTRGSQTFNSSNSEDAWRVFTNFGIFDHPGSKSLRLASCGNSPRLFVLSYEASFHSSSGFISFILRKSEFGSKTRHRQWVWRRSSSIKRPKKKDLPDPDCAMMAV